MSNVGITLSFQAEEAQRKLRRQNREDTGTSHWKEEKAPIKAAVALLCGLAFCSWASQSKVVENVTISLMDRNLLGHGTSLPEGLFL